MRCRIDRTPLARGTWALRGGAALCLLALSACGGMSGPGPSAQVMRVSNTVESAICEGRAADAVTTLSSEPLSSPSDRFYLGLAYEESGRPITARRIYAGLMSSGANDQVYLRCADRVVASGSVSVEAGRRLAEIAGQLQQMDAARMGAVQLPDGLASVSDKPANTVRTSPANMARTAVTRPGSSSPLGRWFAHLSSYRSYEHAEENKSTLEKQFPALTGMIDQWEVNVNGLAVRLGVRISERGDAQLLCNQVKSQGEYCAVLDTSQ